MTLFEALTGGAFDRLNWQHSGEFDQNFSKKSNAPGFARRGMGGFGIDWYIILTYLLCQMYKNPPEFEFQGTIFKFRKRNKLSSLLVYVLHKTRD